MKLFITSKIYDTEKQTIAEIEKAVQDDLDNMVGMDKIRFKLCTLGCVAAMFFNRSVDYSNIGADPKENIIGEDALIITGDRYNGFIMPSPLPPMPYFGHIIYNLEQSDFLEIYKESAKGLRASKIKDAWLEINPGSIILRVQTK